MPIYNQHFLTKPDVLRLVPGLTAPCLKHWTVRGYIDIDDPHPGSGSDRQYSPLGVIKLAAMHQLVELGVTVSAAHDMTYDLAPLVVEAWHLAAASHYPKAFIWREGDTYAMSTRARPDLATINHSSSPRAYITLEIGLLTIEMREKMRRLDAAEDAA